MSYSITNSASETFTATHAKHLASKVAADLKRMQRFYGYPSDSSISSYEAELIEFLKNGYLGTVTYGFKKNGAWIEPTLRYTAKDLAGNTSNDDDPGRILPNADITGADFSSYLIYNEFWYSRSQNEKDEFTRNLPFQRGGAAEPRINGYLSSDKTYSSGGRVLDRSIVKSY